MIKLLRIPDHLNTQWPYLPSQLRARDIEVARCVLEAAALVAYKYGNGAYVIAAEISALKIEGEAP